MACVFVTRELCNMKGSLLLYGDKKRQDKGSKFLESMQFLSS